MQHIEVHMIRTTPDDLRKAVLAGIIEKEINACQICDTKLLFMYVLLNEDTNTATCEYCIRLALARAML